MKKMSLRELLNYVDFDYEIVKNDSLDICSIVAAYI